MYTWRKGASVSVRILHRDGPSEGLSSNSTSKEQAETKLQDLKNREREIARKLRDLYVQRNLISQSSNDTKVIGAINEDIQKGMTELTAARQKKEELNAKLGNKFTNLFNKTLNDIKDTARPNIPVTIRTLGVTANDVKGQYEKQNNEKQQLEKQKNVLAAILVSDSKKEDIGVSQANVGIEKISNGEIKSENTDSSLVGLDDDQKSKVLALNAAKEAQKHSLKKQKDYKERSGQIQKTGEVFQKKEEEAQKGLQELLGSLPQEIKEELLRKVKKSDPDNYHSDTYPEGFDDWEGDKKTDFLIKKQTFYQTTFKNIFYENIISEVIDGYKNSQDMSKKQEFERFIQSFAQEKGLIKEGEVLSPSLIQDILKNPDFISALSQGNNEKLKLFLSFGTNNESGWISKIGSENAGKLLDSVQNFTLNKSRGLTIEMSKIEQVTEKKVIDEEVQKTTEWVEFSKNEVNNEIGNIDAKIENNIQETSSLGNVAEQIENYQKGISFNNESLEEMKPGTNKQFYESSVDGYLIEYDIQKISEDDYRVKFDGGSYRISGDDWEEQLELLKKIRSTPIISIFISSPNSASYYNQLSLEYGGSYNEKSYDHENKFISYLYSRIISVLPEENEFRKNDLNEGIVTEENGVKIQKKLLSDSAFAQDFHNALCTHGVINRGANTANWARFPDDRT